MRISVITVAYNAERTIADTIRSVIGQTHRDLEYIIIDGGSTDETVNIIKSFGTGVTKYVSEPDQGIYDGMNKGINLATGDVIAILNADDFYISDAVLKKVAAAFQENHADAVYGDLVYVSSDDTTRVVRTWHAKPYQEGAFLKGWMPPHPSFFVKRDCYIRYGKFTDKLKSAADYELMLRFIHRHKIKLHYIPEVLVRMRTGGKSNMSFKNRLRANREDRVAWKMNDLKPGTFTFIRKPLSKLTQFLIR